MKQPHYQPQVIRSRLTTNGQQHFTGQPNAGPSAVPHTFERSVHQAHLKIPRKARIALKLLERLQIGTLDVTFPNGSRNVYGNVPAREHEPHAKLVLRNWAVVDAALTSGDIGFGETYMRGDWETDSVERVLSLFIANRAVVEQFIYGTWWGRLLYRMQHLLNRNSRKQARKNIQAHYDLGNPFYRLWLDDTMTYSSALFEGQAQRTLKQAQLAKINRSLDQLHLPSTARVLEIGCGWGGIAQEAAQRGYHLTGLTLSVEQQAFAQERLSKLGLSAHGDIRLQDYRDIDQQFDGIVSIEMFEAVGQQYWDGYFQTLKRCLKPGGRALIQTITIDDQLFERYQHSSDFIQQYIFPGGMLPSPSVFEVHAKAAGLRITDRFEFGQDYARTLALWHQAFLANLHEVRQQGFSEVFVRMWVFYLAYCQAAFAANNINVIQFTLEHDA